MFNSCISLLAIRPICTLLIRKEKDWQQVQKFQRKVLSVLTIYVNWLFRGSHSVVLSEYVVKKVQFEAETHPNP